MLLSQVNCAIVRWECRIVASKMLPLRHLPAGIIIMHLIQLDYKTNAGGGTWVAGLLELIIPTSGYKLTQGDPLKSSVYRLKEDPLLTNGSLRIIYCTVRMEFILPIILNAIRGRWVRFRDILIQLNIVAARPRGNTSGNKKLISRSAKVLGQIPIILSTSK